MQKNVIMSIRIPYQDVKRIEQLVKQGRFMNRSDFLRIAIKKLLELELEKGGS